jgi:monofunctional biosynthetic peptidoglycan transglycosylase
VLLLLSVLAVLALRVWPPATTAFMQEERFAAAAAGDRHYQTRYQWADYPRIAPQAALAVMASEDQQFPFHHGFDVNSIREAEINNAEGRRLHGASTISQQLAKNLFLWPGRSYVRKAVEAWFTVLLETLWPKQRILEVYLNVVQFGQGIFGVEAAAHAFFHVSAAQLTASDAALLAAVLPSPDRLHADRPSPYLLERRDWILGQMRTLGEAGYLNSVAHGAPRLAPPEQPHRNRH